MSVPTSVKDSTEPMLLLLSGGQCHPINSNAPPPPPPPPPPPLTTTTSTRASSRKNRVYAMREFLLKTYPSLFSKNCCAATATVLDVAGGKGDLSWLLSNVDGVRTCAVVDPRPRTDHDRFLRSIRYLRDHPEEARERAAPHRPTHQPLAELLLSSSSSLLLSSSLNSNNNNNNNNNSSNNNNKLESLPTTMTNMENDANDEGQQQQQQQQQLEYRSPLHMRILVDDELVAALREYLRTKDKLAWQKFWERALERARTTRVGDWKATDQQTQRQQQSLSPSSGVTVSDSDRALQILMDASLVVGFHPDQATEACIDLATLLGVPYCIVPCCVFPSEFPGRRTPGGTRVRRYEELLTYLWQTKNGDQHRAMKRSELTFHDDATTTTARNVVLYSEETNQ